MWEGKVTPELKKLYSQYTEMFKGMGPDEYEDIGYESMSYDEFLGYIKECLEKHVEIPDVVGGENGFKDKLGW